MNILIFGAKGYMGGNFFRIFPGSFASDVDIADTKAIGKEIDRIQPDIIINCAAKTGRPNIDWCEDHREDTLRSNVTGPLVLLELCQKAGCYFVHMSSGCIYHGDNNGKGYLENDPPNFFESFYSRSKIWSEQILKEFPLLILRPRMPFEGKPHDRNFITKVLKYERVIDVQNSMTYAPDLFAAAKKLIEKRITGIYNIVNPGSISPYEIMMLYKKIVDPSHNVERLDANLLGSVTKTGRSNCLLSSEKLRTQGIELPDIHQRIREALKEYA
ncbi:hypothetical protein A3D11_04075 [Candidatus Peribacteria bacterium RIFCSPHIGHO2_02_FULL_49_16]|nr:MAG: hypothetical protein A2880_00165 [Candidatus Peribacteria bacterium RIFCSPHIGHO2_01_FULL_49_38]OGJ59176.1 MAG: hypothetical protein A3D11_04075 [Candidatus Peribacteria bacterium RIFCSPHIGHO2_02_FULL_49_16]